MFTGILKALPVPPDRVADITLPPRGKFCPLKLTEATAGAGVGAGVGPPPEGYS